MLKYKVQEAVAVEESAKTHAGIPSHGRARALAKLDGAEHLAAFAAPAERAAACALADPELLAAFRYACE